MTTFPFDIITFYTVSAPQFPYLIFKDGLIFVDFTENMHKNYNFCRRPEDVCLWQNDPLYMTKIK